MSSQRTEKIITQFLTSGEVKTRAYEEICKKKIQIFEILNFFKKNIFEIFVFIFEIFFLK